MKDIGLGVIDRYAVVLVLFTLALAQSLLGLQIPLDLSSATTLLWSLILFTGYFYLVRSLYYFPFVAFKIWTVIKEDYDLFGFSDLKGYGYDFRSRFFIILIVIPLSSAIVLAGFFLALIDYAEPYFDELYSSAKLKALDDRYCLKYFLNLFDRIGVVLIAFTATLPAMQRYVHMLGIIGAIFMIVIYILKGNFTAILKDALNDKATKKDSPDKTIPSAEDNSLNRFGVSIKASHCASCGKLCTENGSNLVPKFCSLTCKQKWYPLWEKDWCIGTGDARKVIDTLRRSGYRDFDEAKRAIEQLEEMASVGFQTRDKVTTVIWSLLAIIRDNENETRDRFALDLRTSVYQTLEGIVSRDPFLVNELVSVVLDESNNVVLIAVELIGKHPPLFNAYLYTMESLLKHESRAVRLGAIEVLGKTHQKQALFDHLGKGENFEDKLIIQTLCSIGESAIPELEQAQKNPRGWIRTEATNALISLGLQATEPDLIEDQIHCPKCRTRITINFPKEYDEIKVTKTNFVREVFYKSTIKVKCPSCRIKLGVELDVSAQRKILLAMAQATKRDNEPMSTRFVSNSEDSLRKRRTIK